MISQTRAVLDRYAAAGGSYEEVVFEGAGHVPFIERLEEFNDVFHTFLQIER
jgi:pimeloyl-ACP methyl ester carboxylesterase